MKTLLNNLFTAYIIVASLIGTLSLIVWVSIFIDYLMGV